MKKFILKYMLASFFAVLLFSACDEEVVRVTSPLTSEDCQSVYFSENNMSAYELDPVLTSVTVVVSRKDSTLAAEVPITVLRNDSDVFVVPETISFAADQATTSIEVTFPDAGLGIAYVLDVAISGEQFVNAYALEPVNYSFSLTRIKWNDLGEGTFYDSFAFYSAVKVNIQQRDDDPSVYRISDPYSVAVLEEAEWTGSIGGETQDYILLNVGETYVTWDKFWYTNLIYSGVVTDPIKAYFPSGLSADLADSDKESIVVKGDDGEIQYLLLNPYYYVSGVGGWGLNPTYIGFPGYDLITELELDVPIFGE